MLFFTILVSLTIAIAGSQWTTQIYLPENGGIFTRVFQTFITGICLYSTFIPVSLFVGIEVVKLMQALMLGWDAEMMSEVNGKL